MRDLLAQGGFCVRTATRADCARCEGRSRGTVSYNAEGRTLLPLRLERQSLRLARDLGLVGQASACRGLSHQGRGENRQAKARPTRRQRAKARREFRRRAQNEDEIRSFARWREERLRQVSDRYHALSRAAVRAEKALASGVLTPEEQSLAWDALARFCHEEASLSAAFDFLMCAKASRWLEDDARIEDLFECWKTLQGSQ